MVQFVSEHIRLIYGRKYTNNSKTMLPTHGHSHGHGGGSHSHGHSHGGGGSLLSANNLMHFASVGITTILYYLLFSWETLFGCFFALLIWSSVAATVVGTFLFGIPMRMLNQFGTRYVVVSFFMYIVIWYDPTPESPLTKNF